MMVNTPSPMDSLLKYNLLRWKNFQEQDFSWNKLRHLEEKNNLMFGRSITGWNYQFQAGKKMDFRTIHCRIIIRWWFETCCIFTVKNGKIIQFYSCCSNGLKPPTRLLFVWFCVCLKFASFLLGQGNLTYRNVRDEEASLKV